MTPAPETLPTFSVIVPITPARNPLVLESLQHLERGDATHEVLVERGLNVSANRNRCVARSRAKILAFADDDCVVEHDWLVRAARFFAANPDFHAVGGPQVSLGSEGALGRATGHALASRFGTFRTRHRFKAGQERRDASERDLTSANLFLTREAFDRWGPFDERLWPNEETALLHRIERGGGRIAYDPSLVVRHRRRDSIGSLAKQCFGYGRGRARQWRIEGARTPGLEQLIPCGFVIYLAILPFLAFLWPAALLPIAAYGSTSLAVSAAIALARADLAAGMLLPIVFAAIHIAYPLGIFFEILAGSKQQRQSSRHAHERSLAAAERSMEMPP